MTLTKQKFEFFFFFLLVKTIVFLDYNKILAQKSILVTIFLWLKSKRDKLLAQEEHANLKFGPFT
jgi:hypothetical protein